MGKRRDYAVEVRRCGELVGRASASLGALREDALFYGVLEGRLPNDCEPPDFAIAPRWADDHRRAVAGLTFSLDGELLREYPRDAFAQQAEGLIADLHAREPERLRGEPLDWELVADQAVPELTGVRVARAPLPFRSHELPRLSRGSFQVEIDGPLLSRLRDAVVRSSGVEYAALLTGRLLHDPARGAGLLQVLDRVELRAGAGGRSRVHFALGADSFLEAARAVRAAGEQVTCGWLHSHPPCEGCVANPDCRANTVFFSAKDIEVHSAAFAPGYMVGLVAGKVPDRPAQSPGFRLYGWRDGVVRERPYHTAGSSPGMRE